MMRAPGIEPGQRAWKALIITPRSHPQTRQVIQELLRIVFFIDIVMSLITFSVSKGKKFYFLRGDEYKNKNEISKESDN